MYRLVYICLTGFLLLGCNDPADKFAPKETLVHPTWPALQKLTSEEIDRPLDMAAQSEDWAGFKKTVTSTEFKAAVEGFAAEAVPAKFASAERKTAKDEAAKAFKELTRLAESGASGKDLKAAYATARQHLQETTKPAAARAD